MKKVLGIILGLLLIFGTVFSSAIFAEASSAIGTIASYATESDVGTDTDVEATPTEPATPETPNDPATEGDVNEEEISKESTETDPEKEVTTETVLIPEATTKVEEDIVGTESDAKKEHGDIIINQGDLNIDIDVTIMHPSNPEKEEDVEQSQVQTETTRNETVENVTIVPEETTDFYYDWKEPSTDDNWEDNLYIPNTGSSKAIGGVIALGIMAAGALMLVKKRKSDEEH